MGSPGLGHGLLLAVAETVHSILSSGDHDFAVLSILGGVGHCYAWHIQVTFGLENVHFLWFLIGKINDL